MDNMCTMYYVNIEVNTLSMRGAFKVERITIVVSIYSPE